MENLRIIREKKGITQVSLSIDIGVAQETISAYESGKAFPSADILMKMADRLGVSTDYLLDRTDIPLVISHSANENMSIDELELITAFRKLTPKQKNRAVGFVLGMVD